MVRRSFRVGLRLGVLAGVLFALVRVIQARRGGRSDETADLPAAEWPPVRVDDPTGAAGRPAASPAPAAGAPVATTEELQVEAATTAAPRGAPATRRADEPEAAEEAGGPARAKGTTAKPAATRKPAGAGKPAGAKKTAAKRASTTRAAAPRARATAPSASWVEPVGGVCPPTHPVKAKLTSGLFHLPGMLAYTRTRPDRCYRDEEAATGDGLTKAKR